MVVLIIIIGGGNVFRISELAIWKAANLLKCQTIFRSNGFSIFFFFFLAESIGKYGQNDDL